MSSIMIRLFVLSMAIFSAMSSQLWAQSSDSDVWIQIEAHPDLGKVLERAEDYTQTLDDVNGFGLGGGWYGILLGPYAPQRAREVMDNFRSDRRIPRDSFIALSSALGQRVYPLGAELLQRDSLTVAPTEAPADPVLPTPLAAPAPAGPTVVSTSEGAPTPQHDQIPQETASQARQSERALSAEDRQSLQRALQWAGFYDAAIDGAFGRGTRSSMAEWQRANGVEPTGILTTRQRAILLGQFNAILDGLGMRRVRDEAAGIEIDLPSAAVSFSRYEPPFAHFDDVNGTRARVLLISQEGDRARLRSLYDVMQTLEIVPLDGPRALSRDSFSLVGRNGQIVSETQVRLEAGQIKGFTLVWPADDEDRRARLVTEMQNSLTRLSTVLDPAISTAADQQVDLVAGLQIRKPRLSRSGFYVDQRGTVVTTLEATESCTRITLDDEITAEIRLTDPALGIAVLAPEQALAPSQVARFSAAPPRLQSDIAIAGYSYEGVLGAPSLTFGTLADVRGLGGETDMNRLDVDGLPGDVGGPVLDSSGHVIGMLLPRDNSGRQLPQTVGFARSGLTIAEALDAAGLSADRAGASSGTLPPEDITTRAAAMTVLVSCWD